MATIKEIIDNHRNKTNSVNIKNAKRLGDYALKSKVYRTDNAIVLALSNTAITLNNAGAKIFSSRNFTSLEIMYDNYSKVIVLVPSTTEDMGGLYMHLSRAKAKPSVTYQSGAKGVIAFMSDIFKRDEKEYWMYHILCTYDKENDAIVAKFADAKLSQAAKRVVKKKEVEN